MGRRGLFLGHRWLDPVAVAREELCICVPRGATEEPSSVSSVDVLKELLLEGLDESESMGPN